MQHGIGGEAVARRLLDRRRELVVRAQQAAAAVDLDALVVAVGGAARVGDLRELAALGLQRDDGGVDVAGLADRRVDQARGHGGDFDRLLAQQEARHVEIVDHHVAEQAAGARDVGDRRRPRIARQDGDDLRLAHFARRQALLQRREAGVEAAVEADHQLGLGVGDHLQAGAHALGREVDRLFAEDRLARFRGLLDQVGVGVGRRADQHRVDVLVADDVGNALGDRGAGLGGDRARRLGIDVEHRGELRGLVRSGRTRVNLADPPSA